jgi:predicted nucleic acid-binding Zn ribbon protein
MKKLLRVDGINKFTERLFHLCDVQIGRIKKLVIARALQAGNCGFFANDSKKVH